MRRIKSNVLSCVSVAAMLSLVFGARGAERDAVRPLALDKPAVAYWAFDEDAGGVCRDATGRGNDARLDGKAALARTAGVFGGAANFAGSHRLQAPGKPDFSKLEKISLSAWVRPARFERYNEIFRKEDGRAGARRVLFSFQENAGILALGLNVNGYVECDARMQPGQVLDGGWHHCAATFDGRTMRVYLDGAELGALERPGKLAAGGDAPGCIGSSHGGECFQGAIDELRIYGDVLTADEIARLHRNGLEALTLIADETRALMQGVYAPGKTFAETLAATRKNLAAKGAALEPQLAQALLQQLRANFPEDYRDFVEFTGAPPLAFLETQDNAAVEKTARRLLKMLLEYRPLTAGQWDRLPPAKHKSWNEAERIEARFERLEHLGAEARFDPEWIAVILEAGRRVEQRPRVSEAVAPYVEPATVETRDLPAAEARQALERDWLHQADGQPTLDRAKQEFAWARQLAARILADYPAADYSKELAELTVLERQALSRTAADAALYFQVREVKRRIALRNPAVDFDQVLFVDMPFPSGSEWPHETRHRLGYMAVPGGRLLVLQGLSPEGRLTQLMPRAPLHGSFWRPDLSFDGRKVLFCFKPHNEKSFHVYEINVDGSGLKQLTDGPYDDLDPIYLPDGEHVMFSTTRGHTYVRCMPPTNAYVLARCDRDGANLYLVSRNNEPDYLPSVLNDGRVVYTRWEYTDKPLWRAQSLWTTRPDGTQVNTFWGNQSVWPDLLKDARAIPGSRRVMFTGSAHHNWFSGSVGIIDTDRGHNFPDGLTKVTVDVAWPESGNGPTDPVESTRYHPSGKYEAYYSPYPLSEKDFLVSAKRGSKFVLYLMDVDGNRELIYEGAHHIFHALPLRPRARPPVIADSVAWPSPKERDKPQPGVIFSHNIYEGAPAELRGKARYLRVLNIEHKTYSYWHKRPYISTGPVVSGIQSEGVKRVLGTVPIESDGSVAFYAPPGIPLHFQLLDERHRALQTMRSFTGVMPGERRGCLGCHKLHSKAGENRARSLALAREPREITPPPFADDTVSWARYVRPVLDKYCAKCHEGEGEGRKTLDLTARPGKLAFDETYWLLIGRPSWGKAYNPPPNPPPGFGIADTLIVEGYGQRDPAAYQTPPPMTRLSYKSRLIERASSGKHHEVKVDPISLRRLILWVDTMCPYRGSEEVRAIPDPEFQGVEWLAVRPQIKNAPTIARPGPLN